MKKREHPVFTVVGFHDEIDLRFISAKAAFLRGVERTENMVHGTAVVYTNVKQDRFRVVLCTEAANYLMIPEYDPDGKLSPYLRVSEALARAGRPAVAKALEKLNEHTVERISLRAKRKRNLTRRLKQG
jgi:hypothetical protein